MRKSTMVLAAMAALAGPVAMWASAKPEFASKEAKKCVYCHLTPVGGPRGFRGIYYLKHKMSFEGFDEVKEAEKAGVKPKALGKNSKPTKLYP